MQLIRHGFYSWSFYFHVIQVNSALHLSRVTKSRTSFGWGKGGNTISARWQVSPCDPIWCVSSHRGEASCRNCYTLFTFILPLLYISGALQNVTFQTLHSQHVLYATCIYMSCVHQCCACSALTSKLQHSFNLPHSSPY